MLKMKPARPPHDEGEIGPVGIQIILWTAPIESSFMEFTVYNPEAEVKFVEQKAGWYRVSMVVYAGRSDVRSLFLQGVEVEVLSEKGDLQHVRLTGWIPDKALSQLPVPTQGQDLQLEVIEWAWRTVSGGIRISGVVRNEGTVTVHNAQVTVSATDELGQPIIPRTVRLKPDSIFPGDTAHFIVLLDTVSVPSQIFVRFKLSGKPEDPPHPVFKALTDI